MAPMAVSTMLKLLGIERYQSAFDDEEISDTSLIRSMGPLMMSNLAELGLDTAAQVQCKTCACLAFARIYRSHMRTASHPEVPSG